MAVLEKAWDPAEQETAVAPARRRCMEAGEAVRRIKARVERLLADGHDADTVPPSADGRYVFPRGTAEYVVELMVGPPLAVRVSAVLLRGIDVRPELLATVNNINQVLEFARMFVVADEVVVATELVATSLDLEELGHACQTIASVADHYDVELQREFGGRTAFPHSDDERLVSLG
jgi:hypothetical protein